MVVNELSKKYSAEKKTNIMGHFTTELKVGLFFLSQNFAIGNMQYSLVDSVYLT